MANLSPIQLARFWSRVRTSSDFQCWNWTGFKSEKGYGRFGGRAAHRLAYEIIKGPIPEGMVVRHKCDNPSCCNPNHLLAGTQKQNIHDCIRRGRFPKGEASARSKITEREALYILKNPDQMRVADLAKKFGISKASVSMIRSSDRWAHLAQ